MYIIYRTECNSLLSVPPLMGSCAEIDVASRYLSAVLKQKFGFGIIRMRKAILNSPLSSSITNIFTIPEHLYDAVVYPKSYLDRLCLRDHWSWLHIRPFREKSNGQRDPRQCNCQCKCEFYTIHVRY